MSSFKHKPVLLDESIEALNIRPDGIYVDLTLGRAGHSEEIAKRLTTGRLICFDKDLTAIEAATERLSPYGDTVTFVKSDFRNVEVELANLGILQVDGILMDLGVSSPQLDNAKRGFSYMNDAPLDMRMDENAALSAHDVVNGWDIADIRRILYTYGEERYAPQISSWIVKGRPVESTGQLVDIIMRAVPAKARREKQHPAKRTFQAIRIAVNDELGALEDALVQGEKLLANGGRIAVITFHSLEDKIVKSFFKEAAVGCTCSKELPICVCGKKAKLKILTRKPIVPSTQEVEENPRSRSAKLRVAERTED